MKTFCGTQQYSKYCEFDENGECTHRLSLSTQCHSRGVFGPAIPLLVPLNATRDPWHTATPRGIWLLSEFWKFWQTIAPSQ